MQQESSPLCAVDVTPGLRKQFAFLSGGRGENGNPIIIFPEFPAFGELQEQEFHNVLTYLTSVPSLSAAGVGFILVIDRRQDRWASVKGTLLRIAGSFPGNLQLVLVLRPTALLQRTLSNFLFQFSKDEFKMKVPVIMLSSITELHSYIDRTQLTQELGGTQEYCHEAWISHRTAIEGFALMVKKTAQTLQSFGTELAETELPNDVQATANLLATHTDKKDQMKEDLKIALNQGGRLLESLNEPLVKDTDYTMNQDELENLATVQRLLGQLDETETAFDDFWERHHTKLEQCLQLRHFEHNYREVSHAGERLSTFSEVGISPAHGEHILKELTCHEERTSVLDQAFTLAGEGDQLIESSHYAVDSILPKCSELRAVAGEISSIMKAKKSHMLKAMELHQSLEKATKWCDEGIYLLASQPVDKCQSQDGAESALQELERYLEMANQHRLTDPSTIWREYETVLNPDFKDQVEKVLQKQVSMQEMFDKRRVSLKKLAARQTRPVQPVAPRPEAYTKSPLSSPGKSLTAEGSISVTNAEGPILFSEFGEHNSRPPSLSEEEENLAVLRRHVMNELLETERAYVEELLCVLQGYAAEMDNPAMAHLIPNTLLNKKDILFDKNSYTFKIDCKVLKCFLLYPVAQMTDLQIYEKYCQNKPRSESLWRQCSDCAFFQECQKKLEHKLGLDSYLLKPVQRITKYQLLLKELLKYSRGCEGASDLQDALTSILGILKAVNDSMHLIAITGYEGNLSDLGRLLMQGSFNVWTEHKKGHSKVKDLARFKPMQRHLFLHEKALLFCKKREENGEGYEKAPSYSFKHSLSMSAVGITENAKGDNKKFEVWWNSREEVYIIQAASPEMKTAWVNEIRKVLTGQLKACKGEATSVGRPMCPGSPALLDLSDISVKSLFLLAVSFCSPCSLLFVCVSRPLAPFSLSLLPPFAPLPGSPPSPDHKTKRHEIKSDPTPFGFRGWTKASLSMDASEEHDGYSSAEDPLNSDPEDEGGKKLVSSAGRYVVVADCDKGPQDLAVKTGDMVELVKEGEDGQWFVKNLKTSKEGWIPASNLLTLLGESESSHSLSSSGKALVDVRVSICACYVG
uniref:Mcf.2 cell line derived transforming sequence-like a n=1 Tax=Denticeps clupeoides TaxID=299321 RepID=A0AAY4EMH3_9TELE